MLDDERLDVYRAAIEFLQIAFTLVERIPRGYGGLGDQLRRAGMSIPLNIAEAAGKSSAKDRAHFHAIARGSAMECGAILDVVTARSWLRGGGKGKAAARTHRVDAQQDVPLNAHAHAHAHEDVYEDVYEDDRAMRARATHKRAESGPGSSWQSFHTALRWRETA